MGLIRVILALSVLGVHYHIQPELGFVGGTVAVKFFYIISGFYMALILQESNEYKSLKLFYMSRYLRLFPVYIIFAIACFIGNFGNTIYGRNFAQDDLSIFTALIIIITNILIIGQDVLFFLGLEAGQLKFVTDFNNSYPYQVYKYMYAPQGFSLAIEISFYIICPFLIKKKNYQLLITMIIMSISLRIYLISIGLAGDPWSSRFFFSELAFFLLGVLGYNFYRDKIFLIRNIFFKKFVYFIFIIILLIYSTVPNHEITKGSNIFINDIIMYLFFTIFIGTIFDFYKDSLKDRIIGEISYPIYCSHLVIIGATKIFGIMSEVSYTNTIILYVITIFISTVTYYFIQIPIDNFRYRLKKNYRI